MPESNSLKRARIDDDRTFRLVDGALEESKIAEQAAMWAAGELCDVTVRAHDGGERRAHKVVLSSASRFFRRSFTAVGAGESIELANVETIGLDLALRFVYHGRVDVPEPAMDALVAALSALEMQPLLAKCIETIVEHLTPGSALGVYELAAAHHLDALAKSALHLASLHFAAAASDPSWASLSLSTVKTLLGRDEVHAIELTVLDALLRWIRADEPARAPTIELLLPLVRFPLMDADELASTLVADPLVTGANCWPALRAEAAKFHAASAEAKLRDTSPRTHSRGEKSWILYSIGGMDGKAVMSSVQRWQMSTEKWEAVEQLSKPRVGHGCAALGGQIYAVGGSDGVHRLSDVERFCPWRGSWERVKPLSCARGDVGVAVVHGQLYAVGGRMQFEPLASAERYCPVRDSWEPIPPMSVPRYHVRCAALDGQVYAIGGGERTRVDGKTTVERFCPRRGTWEEIPPMSTSREGVGIAVLDGKIFATGGSDGQTKLNSCEAFCPVRGVWEAIPNMIARRMSHRTAVLDGKLYVLGGFQGTGECHTYDSHGRLSTVERFDPQTHTWEAVPGMSAEAAIAGSRWHCHGALVVV
jgi:kelch-like protein 17 (actinfilin)